MSDALSGLRRVLIRDLEALGREIALFPDDATVWRTLPGVTNSARVTTPGDLDASNDRDTDATTVQGVPDLTLEKRHVNRFEVGYPGT